MTTSCKTLSVRCRRHLSLAVACAAIGAPAAVRAQDAKAHPSDAEVQFFADKKLSFDSQETSATSTKAQPERPPVTPTPTGSRGAPTAPARAWELKVLSVRAVNEQELGSMKGTLTCSDAFTAEVVPTPALRTLLANLFKMKVEQLPPSFSWVTGRTGSCYDRSQLDPAIARELGRVEDAIRLEAKKGGL